MEEPLRLPRRPPLATRPLLSIVGALLLLSSLSLTARAEFRIADVQARFNGAALVVNGTLDLTLAPKVEEALSKGIELPVIIELRLYHRRRLWWDQRLAAWSVRRVLQYHALSGQYLVDSGSAQESFLSLADALKSFGTLNELRLTLPEIRLAAEDDYAVELRAHLDIEALPAPLRPVAYTTPSWRLNSGWSTWNVAPAVE